MLMIVKRCALGDRKDGKIDGKRTAIHTVDFPKRIAVFSQYSSLFGGGCVKLQSVWSHLIHFPNNVWNLQHEL